MQAPKRKSTIDAAWHRSHRMPKNATLDQRIQWHVAHLKNCNCRYELPVKLRAEMEKRNIVLPSFTEANDHDDKQAE